MTRQAAEAAGGEVGQPADPQQHESRADGRDPARHRRPRPRGRLQLADPARRACAPPREHEGEGRERQLLRVGAPRRLVADLPRARGRRAPTPASPSARPTPTRARSPQDLMAAYVDGEVDRVEIFYNGYVSPLVQEVRRETLLPLQEATILESAATTRTTTRARRDRAPRARRVRAGPRGDPRAPRPRLRRDLALPGAAGVDARPSSARA